MTIVGAIGGTIEKVLTAGPVGGLLSGAADSAAGVVLQGISSWVLNGTKSALQEVASVIGSATAPNLNSTWFSSTYWRVAALAAMLTIPFLCAATVQAIARSDLSLLTRAAFGYLPLSLLGVSLAAPLTMLLLAATDQMCVLVSGSGVSGGARFLDHAADAAGTLASASGSPFFAVIIGLFAVMAGLALAIELLVRAAAVYIVVLMLPLAFAALVWPARRVWAVRLVELLASLILSKFVIVAVLSLAAAAFATGTPGISELLVAMSLMLLATFAPWALMRILPFTELAAGAAAVLHNEMPYSNARAAVSSQLTGGAGEFATLPMRLREQARMAHAGRGGGSQPSSGAAAPETGGPVLFDQHAPEPPSAETETQAAAGFGPDAGGGAMQPAGGVLPGAATLSAGGMRPGAATQPSGGTAQPASGTRPSATTQPAAGPEDTREPFVPPDAWNGDEPIRLGRDFLRPPGPAPREPEERDE